LIAGGKIQAAVLKHDLKSTQFIKRYKQTDPQRYEVKA